MNHSVQDVAILGAGNGGCASAADLAGRGFRVRLHARREERLSQLKEAGGLHTRGISNGFVPLTNLTTDVASAVEGADLIMVTVPATGHEYYAAALAPLITDRQPIFLNPGHTGGSLHFRHELRRHGYTGPLHICETVTLTYICRLEGPATIGIYSRTGGLAAAALPASEREDILTRLGALIRGVKPAGNVLETGLANINAILHPPPMLMNAGWIEATGGDFLFYREGVTEAVGRVMEAIDAERLAVASGLNVPARPLIEIFHDAGLTTDEALESQSLSHACWQSEPNRTIRSPATLDHRYLHEDVACGLVPIAELGLLAQVATPCIDALINLAGIAMGRAYRLDGLTLERMGLDLSSRTDIDELLHEGDL